MFKRIIWLFLLPLYVQAQSPNWAEDVASILYNKCTKCHNNTGSAPFPLMTYLDAESHKFQIQYAINGKKMPPWPPDTTFSRLAHERTLTAQEASTINDWVNNNAPSGNITLAPTQPVYSGNAQLTQPDFMGRIPTFTVNTTSGDDLYQCFVIPSGLLAQRYIQQMEILPGNRNIVHHVLIFQDPTNASRILDSLSPGPGYPSFGGPGSSSAKLIGAWVPGQGVQFYPTGMGMRLPANCDLVLQIHYPAGISNALDSTQIRLQYDPSSVVRSLNLEPILNHSTTLTNGPLFIPANTTRTFNAQFTINSNISLLGVGPHMHLIGKSIKAYGVTPTNDTLPFISIPNWDFHWQGFYNFRKVMRLPAGTRLYSEAFYDNTTANPHNPSMPPQNVSLGEATTDEMMLVYFTYLPYRTGDENIIIDSSAVITSVIPDDGIVSTFQMYEPYPNPTLDQLTLAYYLPKAETVKIAIINITGQKVFEKASQNNNSGMQQIQLPTGELPKGIYTIQLTIGSSSKTKTFVKQ